MRLRKSFFLIFALSSFCSPLISALRDYTGPAYDSVPRKTLDNAAEKLGAPLHLKLICSGLGSLAKASTTSGLTPWGLLFTSPQKLELAQAETLAQDITAKLLKTIHEDPCFAGYYAGVRAQYPKWEHPYNLSDNSLAIRIDFWDEEVNRPLPPYIAEIRFVEGNLYYVYADPKTQGLQEPFLVRPFTPKP